MRLVTVHCVSVNATGCECDQYLLKFIFSFLGSDVKAKCGVKIIQLAMPPEFGRKSLTGCFNTGFLLPTLPCSEYSMRLK